MLHALQQAVARSLTGELLRSLAVPVPRAVVDRALLQLLRTFNLNVALPFMRVNAHLIIITLIYKPQTLTIIELMIILTIMIMMITTMVITIG